MSTGSLSRLDHKETDKDDMRYLVQPRGPGKSWVFRMLTPPDLIGLPNPWDGKPLGKEIKKGLATRHLPEARKRRDIALGDIRRLQRQLSNDDAWSLQSAMAWREMTEEAQRRQDGEDIVEGYDLVLNDRVEQAASQGVPSATVKRFIRIASGKGYLLTLAHEQYVDARRPGNPYGYSPLKRTTVMNLDTAMKHLRAFLSDDANTACMEDVTPDLARSFRDTYLPSLQKHRSPEGLSAKTVAKNVTLLKMMWVWAAESGRLPKKHRNPWDFPKGISRTTNSQTKAREDYRPEETVKLLKATERGSRQGDVVRLAIATGCRADEIATISIKDIKGDGVGFYLAHGKSKNALRFIPVVGAARTLLQARVAAHGSSGRVFPEWPIRPASGKAAAVSQWFTRFRREVLGVETDKRLALHSTRHTWRTVARRAGVREADINDLGGWAGQRTSSSVYDHGLLEDQLEAAQQKVWDELQRAGYLEGF
ncbi:tyrosine-type recombinase/integrase [Albidovulum sediminis]|uniref:Tyrosine-type recombinase/integrase n=1 Tax=Albidovulum sediminis TaxID=3066345 RepID=A0ABT2NLT4_9RHOB|nr:tyrosine-type recombinase/integrase [Defluviimonas sediminis]MCT8328934.1 tyrosine-type recombinase/integrase [Defluviimonas sediminis]